MALINLSVEHGMSVDDARARLELVTRQIQDRFSALIQRTDWSLDRNAVTIVGRGFLIDLRVDAKVVHVQIDPQLLSGLLQTPLVAGLRNVVQTAFQKRLK